MMEFYRKIKDLVFRPSSWFILYLIMIGALIIIGLMRWGHISDLWVDIPATMIGFPSGYLYLFFSKAELGGEYKALFAFNFLTFYLFFVQTLFWLKAKKTYIKWLLIILFLVMILNFSGCARVIDFYFT